MKVAIFVDGANMFYAQRDNGWPIEYKKVYQYFGEGKDNDIFAAYYFTGTPPFKDIQQIEKYRKFKRALTYMGYTVIDKETKVITDRKSGQKIRKANLDVEITLSVLTSMRGYDTAIFLTGDSDFAPLLKHLRDNGKQVIVVSRKQSTAEELINISNKFIDLNEIRAEIEKI